jgi:hypothetical protein
VPLVIDFDPPVRRVGMSIGNGDGLKTRAVLTAFDATGAAIASATRLSVAGDVLEFVGLDAMVAAIVRVELDYGARTAPELIDDLLFE